jgi:hypothetical protein
MARTITLVLSEHEADMVERAIKARATILDGRTISGRAAVEYRELHGLIRHQLKHQQQGDKRHG